MRAKELKKLKELSAEVVGMYSGYLLSRGARAKMTQLNNLIQSIEGRKPARPKIIGTVEELEEPIAHHPV